MKENLEKRDNCLLEWLGNVTVTSVGTFLVDIPQFGSIDLVTLEQGLCCSNNDIKYIISSERILLCDSTLLLHSNHMPASAYCMNHSVSGC